MNEAKVMEVLRRVEWGSGGLADQYCRMCFCWRESGHHEDCKLAALLYEEKDHRERRLLRLEATMARLKAG